MSPRGTCQRLFWARKLQFRSVFLRRPCSGWHIRTESARRRGVRNRDHDLSKTFRSTCVICFSLISRKGKIMCELIKAGLGQTQTKIFNEDLILEQLCECLYVITTGYLINFSCSSAQHHLHTEHHSHKQHRRSS